MTYLISILRYALTAGILFGFPALALSALRDGGHRRLMVLTLAAFGVVIAYSLMAASSRFGNPLTSSAGYAHTAALALLRFGLSLGVPLVTTALATRVFAREQIPFWTVYAATVGASAFGWIAGTLCAIVLL